MKAARSARSGKSVATDAATIKAVLEGRHDDPFAVLGVHEAAGGFIARCFVPDAGTVIAHTLDMKPCGVLECRDPAGFFEGKLTIRKRQPLRYHARNAGGEWWLTDAYSFGPVLGPMDDYYIAEGSHLRLFDKAVGMGTRFAILGTGEKHLEKAMAAAAIRHPGRVGAIIGYDEKLAHLLQGGADAILIPSRFEPCGLTQLYGLRYGCVPMVARTGGLADTVIDANEAALVAGVATGIVFAPENGDALLDAFGKLHRLRGRTDVWSRMQKQGMKADMSWRRSAARYLELFRSLTGNAA